MCSFFSVKQHTNPIRFLLFAFEYFVLTRKKIITKPHDQQFFLMNINRTKKLGKPRTSVSRRRAKTGTVFLIQTTPITAVILLIGLQSIGLQLTAARIVYIKRGRNFA